MRCSGSGGTRDLIFLLIATAALGAANVHAETPGGATIAAPVVGEVAGPPPIDLFAPSTPVPTPFVPYASQRADIELIKPVESARLQTAPAAPPVVAMPPTVKVLGPGEMVPVTLPSAAEVAISPQPAVKEQGTTAVMAKPVESATPPSDETPAPMRPITRARPASAPSAVKVGKPKNGNEVPAIPVSAPVAPTEIVRPPIRFSFPQPIIPLESSLRRRFGGGERH